MAVNSQLIKKSNQGGYKNVFPKSYLDNIIDKESGRTLSDILSGFNMYFLSYTGSRSQTRLQVPEVLRKKGLWITYVLFDNTVITEWYNSSSIDDTAWQDNSNWRDGSNSLVGDISISSNGNWVINGIETDIPARGPQGDTGSQGVSGIPGVSIEVRYCLGTNSSYNGTSSPSGNNPSGWSTSIPSVTSSKPYIWCIQGRREYSSASDATGTIDWGTPFRLSGINGLNGTDGKDGKKGQLVYPAGIYSNTTSYTTDEYKAPYVLDSSDNNFYVLNAQMTWRGTSQGNITPSQDYAQNRGKYWLKFDAFEAVYAKIGIIANGLIGSAVFNGDYMFSQQGINPSASNASTSHYELFNPSSIYNGSFTPNIMFNFKTGAGHLAAGKIKFDEEGNITMPGTIIYDWGQMSGNIYDISKGGAQYKTLTGDTTIIINKVDGFIGVTGKLLISGNYLLHINETAISSYAYSGDPVLFEITSLPDSATSDAIVLMHLPNSDTVKCLYV